MRVRTSSKEVLQMDCFLCAVLFRLFTRLINLFGPIGLTRSYSLYTTLTKCYYCSRGFKKCYYRRLAYKKNQLVNQASLTFAGAFIVRENGRKLAEIMIEFDENIFKE